jgi:hypothetical protein
MRWKAYLLQSPPFFVLGLEYQIESTARDALNIYFGPGGTQV